MSRILIANFYPVFPFEHGGQRRIFFLARELARSFQVTLVTLNRGRPLEYLEIDRGLTEIKVPAEDEYLEKERALTSELPMAYDVAYAKLWKKCRLYQSILRERLRASQVAITEHPYSIYAIQSAIGRHRNLPLIYNSQNVEIAQKAPVLAGRDDLMDVVRSVERTAVTASRAVIACSETDASSFLAEYSVPATKIRIVRNGVDTSAAPAVPSAKRESYKQSLGLDGRFVAIFGGSFHFPNLSAVDCILAAAERLPDVIFVILGSVCNCPALQGAVPRNVLTLGSVPEAEKWLAFAVSDVALNPMSLGSGSNVKMFEYAAARLPTISTAFGARGTGMKPGLHYFEADTQGFATKIAEVARLNRERLTQVGIAACEFVRETSDWSVLGERYRSIISEVLA